MSIAMVGMTVLPLLLLGVAAPSSSCMQRPHRQLQLLGGEGSQEGHQEAWLPDRQQQLLGVKERRVRVSLPAAAAAGKSDTAAATTPQVLALLVQDQHLGSGVTLQQQQGQEVGLRAVRLVVLTLLHMLLQVQREQVPRAAARAGSSTSLPAGPRKLSDCCRRCMSNSDIFIYRFHM